MLNKNVWEQLEKSRSSLAGSIVLRLHPESKFNIFAAIDPVTKNRFLLLKSNKRDVRPQQQLPVGRGFNCRFIFTATDPDGINCLQFELTELRHADVFDVIGNDILKYILQISDDKAAFATFVGRITEWQRFLDQLPKKGLSETEQQGLFGELWFLREVLLRKLTPDEAVSSWAGPRALAKDFQFSGVAFEVKTTSAKQHSRFTISNEQQLDASGVGRLILFCLLLERLAAGGVSLPDLVSSIRAELQAHAASAIRFSELLLQAGYIHGDAVQYISHYSVRSRHFFDVRDDFPRIVEVDLRRGVGDVRYSVLLSECEHYAINEPEVQNIIRTVTV